MAKKKETIVINDAELIPTTIGKLDNKGKSPILLIFVFFIFIGSAFFLPDITNYVNKWLNGDSVKPTEVNNEQKQQPKQEQGEEITFYDYNTDLVISNDLFSISNINYTNNTISFNLKNLTNKVLNWDNLKYYLEIYDSNNTLIERIKISYGLVNTDSTESYTYDVANITTLTNTKLLVVSKTENDYPEVKLNSAASGEASLKCSKGINEINYSFVNNYLVSISDNTNYVFDSVSNYNAALSNYQSMATKYNNYEGVSATLITSTTGFTYTALIDLKTANIKQMDNHNYYEYKTTAKIVKFETEANGYSCDA